MLANYNKNFNILFILSILIFSIYFSILFGLIGNKGVDTDIYLEYYSNIFE